MAMPSSPLRISCSPSPSPVAIAPGAAHLKRFMEWWHADPAFRAELESGRYDGVARRGLAVDAEAVRVLWDSALAPQLDAVLQDVSAPIDDPLVADGIGLLRLWRADAEHQAIHHPTPADARFATWRARQIARMRTALGHVRLNAISHMLFACELTEGCSVGCWFCGVDAQKMGEHFRATPDNVLLWEGVLDTFAESFGAEASRAGLLFWATDPLDNPDYEIFCERFRALFGAPPPTTTAVALRDPERTRRLIRAIATPERPSHLRFSVLSVRMLEQLHAAFTAEELGAVHLIPHLKGSSYELSLSGRARKQPQRARTAAAVEADGASQGGDSLRTGQTIACVSGFLLNMVRRSVQLITPCDADDRWPLGYWILDERSFASAGELRDAIETMIATHMPPRFPAERVARFRRDLQHVPIEDGFAVVSAYGCEQFTGDAVMTFVGAAVARGVLTAEAIVAISGAGEAAREAIETLFARGVLDEEPEVRA